MVRGRLFGRWGPAVLGALGLLSAGAGLALGREGLVVIGVAAAAGAALAALPLRHGGGGDDEPPGAG
ncbi:MAG: hypothetical protein KatS3mg064_0152 [Tepidiforma sp.]|nr:MAG: hypothetical protein KatS3mg064_0152 [Tepidiforma sp.]